MSAIMGESGEPMKVPLLLVNLIIKRKIYRF